MVAMKRKPQLARRETSSDFGPQARLLRQDVVVIDAPDPDQPKGVMIRRAQLHDPVRASVARGGMPYRCYLAAEKFRQDYRLSEADARIPSQLRPRIVAGGLGGDAPPVNWIAAKGRVGQALRVVGLQAQGVFWWCVVPRPAGDGRTFGLLTDYDTTRGWRKGSAADQLSAALTRLSDHYKLIDHNVPKDFR